MRQNRNSVNVCRNSSRISFVWKDSVSQKRQGMDLPYPLSFSGLKFKDIHIFFQFVCNVFHFSGIVGNVGYNAADFGYGHRSFLGICRVLFCDGGQVLDDIDNIDSGLVHLPCLVGNAGDAFNGMVNAVFHLCKDFIGLCDMFRLHP